MVVGGHTWLQGACMVARGCAWLWGTSMVGGCMVAGGMHGCQLVCLVAGGVHRIRRDTVNERAVRILLECILVIFNFSSNFDKFRHQGLTTSLVESWIRPSFVYVYHTCDSVCDCEKIIVRNGFHLLLSRCRKNNCCKDPFTLTKSEREHKSKNFVWIVAATQCE